jgi:hypothetical protein
MTNYEKFKETIVDLLTTTGGGLAVVNGEPRTCVTTSCKTCDFHTSGEYQCKSKRIGWLDAEYFEKPKLTKAERYYCKALRPESVINRNMYGEIIITSDGYYAVPNLTVFNDVRFSFIKGYNGWKVEDLLKLEVIDDE